MHILTSNTVSAVAAELAVDSEDEELVLELVEERRLSEDRVMGESSVKGHIVQWHCVSIHMWVSL